MNPFLEVIATIILAERPDLKPIITTSTAW